MSRISPSTLSVIAAALSVERNYQSMTHWEIEQALMNACGVSTTSSSNELSAGEYYLVVDEDDRYNSPEDIHSREGLENFIQDMTEEMEARDFDDRFTTYIVRKQVKMRTERRVKVIFE